jgi:hypothetical protein
MKEIDRERDHEGSIRVLEQKPCLGLFRGSPPERGQPNRLIYSQLD